MVACETISAPAVLLQVEPLVKDVKLNGRSLTSGGVGQTFIGLLETDVY